MNLQRYHSANLPELMKIISKNGIGMDDYLNRFFNDYETTSNYPPYNLVQLNNIESLLEIDLRKMKFMFILSTESYSLKAKEKLIKIQDPSISIKAWLREISKESGHFQKMLKSERFNSKMDFLPLSWVR